MDIGEIKGAVKIENGTMVLTIAEQERMKLIRRLAVIGGAYVDEDGYMEIHFDLRGNTSSGSEEEAEDVKQSPNVDELLDSIMEKRKIDTDGDKELPNMDDLMGKINEPKKLEEVDEEKYKTRGEVAELYGGLVEEEEEREIKGNPEDSSENWEERSIITNELHERLAGLFGEKVEDDTNESKELSDLYDSSAGPYLGLVDDEEADYGGLVDTKTQTGRRSIADLTIEEKEFLVDLYINDIPTKVIMASENVTKSALYSSLERERIPRKGKLNTIIRRLEDGDKPLEISSEEDTDISVINRIIKTLE